MALLFYYCHLFASIHQHFLLLLLLIISTTITTHAANTNTIIKNSFKVIYTVYFTYLFQSRINMVKKYSNNN